MAMEQVAESEKVAIEEPFTVGHLLTETPGFRRIAYCGNCQERITLPVTSLVEAHGAAAPIGKVLAELACPRCTASAINVTMARLG
jgi:hypothetical protein